MSANSRKEALARRVRKVLDEIAPENISTQQLLEHLRRNNIDFIKTSHLDVVLAEIIFKATEEPLDIDVYVNLGVHLAVGIRGIRSLLDVAQDVFQRTILKPIDDNGDIEWFEDYAMGLLDICGRPIRARILCGVRYRTSHGGLITES